MIPQTPRGDPEIRTVNMLISVADEPVGHSNSDPARSTS